MSDQRQIPAPRETLDPRTEARIATLPTNARMRAALRLVADGWTYREAAKAAGYASPKDLHGWAKRAGLLDAHTERLVAGLRRVASLSTEEIERRLEEAPEEISTKDLGVIAGIATDKIARFEGWSGGADPEASRRRGEQISDVLEMLAQAGAVRVSLEVGPTDRDGRESIRRKSGDHDEGPASGAALESKAQALAQTSGSSQAK
jgi:hypothetical protein